MSVLSKMMYFIRNNIPYIGDPSYSQQRLTFIRGHLIPLPTLEDDGLTPVQDPMIVDLTGDP